MILEMYLKGHYSRQNGNICFIFLYLCSIGNNASILLCTGWSSSNRLHYMPSCTQHIFDDIIIFVLYIIQTYFVFQGLHFFAHIIFQKIVCYISSLCIITLRKPLLNDIIGHRCKIQRLITHEISFAYILTLLFQFLCL